MKLEEINLKWLDDVEEKDFDAAEVFLTLFLDRERAAHVAQSLRQEAETTSFRANDILRAARREPLPISDPGVDQALRHVLLGQALSPALVISTGRGCEICDGYHRTSLAYQLNPFMDVPVRLSSFFWDR